MWTALFFGYLLTWAVIPHVVLAKKRPVATLAWIWFILLFPYLGALAYLLVGADRIKRRRLQRARQSNFARHRESELTGVLLGKVPPPTAAAIRSLANINQVPPSTADELRLLVDAHEFYPALKQRIREAKHHVHIEFFIWRADERGKEFLDVLVETAKRGVEVRLLLDQIGCMGVKSSFFEPLVREGGKFSWFYSTPYWNHWRFWNLRNHRKLQVIDGTVAFIGGMNIGKEYACEDPKCGLWRDSQLEIQGHVVTFLQEIFATDWFFATEEKLLDPSYYPQKQISGAHLCQIIAGGPDLPREPIPKSLTVLLNNAFKRVWLATGYFAPDLLLLSSLQICAARGVDVRVLVSEKSDHPYLVQIGRSYYEDLLRFGVRVFEYSKGINHSKAMVIDGEWLMVGSANSDNRSMRLNFELNLLAHAPDEAARLEATLARDFEDSTEITLEDFVKRPFRRQLVEAALRPLAPLL